MFSDMTNVEIKKSVVDNLSQKEHHIQFMPFNIKFNGETQIMDRFNPETKEDKERGCLGNFYSTPATFMKMWKSVK